MVRRSRFDAVVGDIYDAAVAPDGLHRIALMVTEAASGGSASVGLHDGDGFGEVVTCNLPSDALESYAAYYHRINPYVPIAFARGAFHMARCSDLLSDSSVRRTEFYTDFLRKYDTIRCVGTPRITLAPDFALEIGVHRGTGSREFSECDVSRLQRLAPHLRRAMQLRRRMGVGLRHETGLEVLEALAFACVICDERGRVLFANEAARALEAAGRIVLAASREGLGVPDAAQSRQLAMLVAGTAAGTSGGAIVLTAGDGKRLFALVTPLPRRFDDRPGHVLVTLRSESSCPPFGAATLRRLFGLTTAEAGLALAIAAGRSLSDIGAERHVSENTLRTQIASVLRKTETANQRELVRMLTLMPPVRELIAPKESRSGS